MVIYNLDNSHAHCSVAILYKHQPMWMNQCHGVLAGAVACERVAPSNGELNQEFDRVRGLNLIDSLVNLYSNSVTVSGYRVI